jgi:hypothetical protein
VPSLSSCQVGAALCCTALCGAVLRCARRNKRQPLWLRAAMVLFALAADVCGALCCAVLCCPALPRCAALCCAGMGEIQEMQDRLTASRRFREASAWVIPLHSTVSPKCVRHDYCMVLPSAA